MAPRVAERRVKCHNGHRSKHNLKEDEPQYVCLLFHRARSHFRLTWT